MKVLVTGANGLLGQKLVKLLAAELELVATSRGANRNPDQQGYTYIPCDLTDKKAVEQLVQQADPKIIIHCAAMTQVDECELNPEVCRKANVEATAYLLEASTPFNPFFLFVSTDFVFDGTRAMLDEQEEPNPISVYGKSKLQAEQLVKNSGLSWSIIRTVLVYGIAFDPSRSNIVLWVKGSLEKGNLIRVVDDQFRTPTLAEDLAEGCRLVATGRHQGIFHLSGEELLTPYEIALRIADYFGLNQNLITRVNADTFSQPGKRPLKTGFNISKAKRELGFRPRSFSEGLEIIFNQ
jgi:dTDP-4-dehydrorhamnose reductase